MRFKFALGVCIGVKYHLVLKIQGFNLSPLPHIQIPHDFK